MGFFDKFKQIYNEEVLGEQTIEAVVTIFQKAQKARPHEEPHEALASTWLHRMKLLGHDVNRQDIVVTALGETLLHACIKPPLCARSLGLYFLYKENPQIIAKYPKFAEEFNVLIGPVLQAQEAETMMDLYSKYNPRMAKDEEEET
jgi:hypothetical protein